MSCPQGWTVISRSTCVGQGRGAYERARELLSSWRVMEQVELEEGRRVIYGAAGGVGRDLVAADEEREGEGDERGDLREVRGLRC
eukprot:222535-Hanusia_phi.AAC.3